MKRGEEYKEIGEDRREREENERRDEPKEEMR